MTETGWVIEHDSPFGLLYWSAFKWTTDNLEAVRFARREDAQKIAHIYRLTPGVRVADHMWYCGSYEETT